MLLGYYRPDGTLAYAGRVGTGFSQETLRDLAARMRPLEQARTPFNKLPSDVPKSGVHWVKPTLVAQVEFNNWTKEGLLRQAAFLGLREDKPASAIVREKPAAVEEVVDEQAPKNAPKRQAQLKDKRVLPDVRLTHPERVIYPDAGITKGELAGYFAQVADWMLPHVAGRLLSLVRCPEGIGGQRFFQKHPAAGMPEYIQRVPVEEKDGVEDHLVVNDVEGLVTLIQFGVVEIHVWGSKAADFERADRLVFDMDPDPAVSWKEVIDSAILLRSLLQELGLKSFVKTTGGKGLHVVVPVQPRLNWDETKAFCKSVASLLETAAPDRFIVNMSKVARRGKIFIDYLRNGRGATAIAPFSTRAHPGAPVATPVSWDELPRLKSPQEFTIRNLPRRLSALKHDPWDELIKVRQSISAAALEQLDNARHSFGKRL